MEKIKLSLWDAFAFISSSFVLHFSFIANEQFVLGNVLIKSWDNLSYLVQVAWIFFVMGYLLLSGMIFEPIANKIHVWLFKLFKDEKYNNEDEMRELAEFIKRDVHSRTGFLIKGNPYHFVKDYLTDRGRSSLFLVFLSKYGFYRSCSAVFLGLVLRNLVAFNCESLISAVVYVFIGGLCYKRANMFYDYQGPTLYRTYLMGIDKAGEKLK